jgi:hypothetical protein
MNSGARRAPTVQPERACRSPHLCRRASAGPLVLSWGSEHLADWPRGFRSGRGGELHREVGSVLLATFAEVPLYASDLRGIDVPDVCDPDTRTTPESTGLVASPQDEVGNYTGRSAPFSSQHLRKSPWIRPTSGASTSPDVCDPYTRTTPESTGLVASPQDDQQERARRRRLPSHRDWRCGSAASEPVVGPTASFAARPPASRFGEPRRWRAERRQCISSVGGHGQAGCRLPRDRAGCAERTSRPSPGGHDRVAEASVATAAKEWRACDWPGH